MARITVEDSIQYVPNQFDLVLVAAQRVRQILAGSALRVERNDDKNTVVALREIAEDKVDIADIYEQLIKGKQHFIESDDFDEDLVDQEDFSTWIGVEKGLAQEAVAFEDSDDLEEGTDGDESVDVDESEQEVSLEDLEKADPNE